MKFYFAHQQTIPVNDNFKLKKKKNKVYIKKMKVYGGLASFSSFYYSFLYVWFSSCLVFFCHDD